MENCGGKRVLVLATSHAQLGATGRRTGAYLAELADVCAVLHGLQVAVDIASPRGGVVPIDPGSRASAVAGAGELAQQTIALDAVNEEYDAYVAVGGRGALWDLASDTRVGRLFAEAAAKRKVLAAVAQGVAALLALEGAGSSLLRGRAMTAATDEEERIIGTTSALPYSLEAELRRVGAKFQAGPAWSEYVATDERLVTGQNPLSAAGVARAVERLLRAG